MTTGNTVTAAWIQIVVIPAKAGIQLINTPYGFASGYCDDGQGTVIQIVVIPAKAGIQLINTPYGFASLAL